MKHALSLSVALLGAMTVFGGQALAANMCWTDNLTCATTMPIGGYCECTARGNTESGSVAESGPVHRGHHWQSATAGRCGAHPNAPGCH